ncbi:MAG TPA: hypothetical protein EYN66_13115 [Myxococcales bacterium]|nr:hypothetical protein [Myxococcales bacterium]
MNPKKQCTMRVFVITLSLCTISFAGCTTKQKDTTAAKTSAAAPLKNDRWNAAQKDFQTEQLKEMPALFPDWEFPDGSVETVVNCIVKKDLAFLNSTQCQYSHEAGAPNTETQLKKQKVCTYKAGYEQQKHAHAVACAKEHIKNDWSLQRKVIARNLVRVIGKLNQEGLSGKNLQTTADCGAAKTVELLNQAKCNVLNPDAETTDELAHSVSDCLGKKRILAVAVSQAIGECAKAFVTTK